MMIQHEIRNDTAVSNLRVRAVSFDAPWSWLADGWCDLWAMPRLSLAYGAVFALAAAILMFGLSRRGMESLVLALGGGFMLIGPVTAVGLYEMSRRIQEGEPVTLAAVARRVFSASSRLGFFGAILAFAYIVWLQFALLLFMLFFGERSFPPASDFVPTLLFTSHGLGLLVIGTIVGGILAMFVFSISVISVPLQMIYRLDAVTAMRTSLEAVARNPKPMLLWAALIAGFMSLGIASMFVGLIIVFPLVGHASWHAFRDAVSHEPVSSL